MSSFNRRFFLCSAAAFGSAVSGCGFTPVYGTDGAASVLLNAVLVDEPSTNETFLLVREVEDRLGRPGSDARFGLSMALDISIATVGKTVAQVSNRFDILGGVTYALRDLGTQEVRSTGRVTSFASYSASGSTVSELAARQDAYERLMVILADRVVTELQAAEVARSA